MCVSHAVNKPFNISDKCVYTNIIYNRSDHCWRLHNQCTVLFTQAHTYFGNVYVDACPERKWKYNFVYNACWVFIDLQTNGILNSALMDMGNKQDQDYFQTDHWVISGVFSVAVDRAIWLIFEKIKTLRKSLIECRPINMSQYIIDVNT